MGHRGLLYYIYNFSIKTTRRLLIIYSVTNTDKDLYIDRDVMLMSFGGDKWR